MSPPLLIRGDPIKKDLGDNSLQDSKVKRSIKFRSWSLCIRPLCLNQLLPILVYLFSFLAPYLGTGTNLVIIYLSFMSSFFIFTSNIPGPTGIQHSCHSRHNLTQKHTNLHFRFQWLHRFESLYSPRIKAATKLSLAKLLHINCQNMYLGVMSEIHGHPLVSMQN